MNETKDDSKDMKTTDDGFKDLLLREYDYLSRLFIENENLGEKRVELFITLTTAVLALFAALSGSGIPLLGIEGDPKLFLVGSVVLFLFGMVTLQRIITRNIVTDKNADRLDAIRRYFVSSTEEEKIAHLPFNPYHGKKPHSIDKGLRPLFSIGRGGLLENVILMNSLIITSFVISLLGLIPFEADKLVQIFVYGLVAIIVFIGGWVIQMDYVRKKYEAKHMKEKEEEIIKAAGGLVWREVNGSKVLALIKRSRYEKEGWTLPKGKLKRGESWKQAAIREVCEEIGCKQKDLSIGSFAGCISYLVGDKPKILVFWIMKLKPDFEKNNRDKEVVEVKWVPISQALKDLHYPKQKEILKMSMNKIV